MTEKRLTTKNPKHPRSRALMVLKKLIRLRSSFPPIPTGPRTFGLTMNGQVRSSLRCFFSILLLHSKNSVDQIPKEN